MRTPRSHRRAPRLVRGGFVLVAFASMAACWGEDVELIELEPLALTQERSLRIRVVADTVLVDDAETGERVGLRLPGEPTFLRGSLEVLQQHRRVAGGEEDDPWTLGLHPEGYPVLYDRASGSFMDLGAMGARTNEELEELFGTRAAAGGTPLNAIPVALPAPPVGSSVGTPPAERPMRTREILGAGLASLGIWWVTTAVLIFFNFVEGAGPWVAGVSLTLAALGAGWLLRHGHRQGVADTYLSFTAGLMVWGFVKSSFYSGFIVGPPVGPEGLPPMGLGPSVDSFLQVLRLSIYHELLAFALVVVAIRQARRVANPVGFHVFILLYACHESAKLNVFLGVQNTSADLIPDSVNHLRPFMTGASWNPLFAVSVTLITIVGWSLLRQSLDAELPRWQRIGAVLVGTMGFLGLLEHWFLMFPMGGFGA